MVTSDAADRLAQALRDLIKEAAHGADRGLAPSVPPQGCQSHDPDADRRGRRRNEQYSDELAKASPEMSTRRLVTVAEARRQLGGISQSTLYSLIKNGELPLVKIGRRSFVPASAIDEFIDRHQT